MELVEVTLSQDHLMNASVRERRNGADGQERQQCQIVRELRVLEERKVDFQETWEIPYQAFVSWDEVGVVAAGVEEGFSSGYTMVDKT